MYFEIYLDEFFLVNFFMDYAVMTITAGVLARTTAQDLREILVSGVRKTAAALIGSAWATTMVAFGWFTPIFFVATYVVICPVMAAVTLWEKKLSKMVRGVLMTYLAAALLSGLMHIVSNYVPIGHLWQLILCALAGTAAIRCGVFDIKRSVRTGQFRYVVYIENNDETVRLRALCDTGNSLFDPIYRRQVNLVSQKCVESMIKPDESCGYHLIPYRSVGEPAGLIPVVVFDKLTIVAGKKKIIITKPLFALYSGDFGGGGDYSVILHPDMINAGES